MDTQWSPKILVLGPGGAKGFLELGSLLYLQQNNMLTNVHTIVGVSVGAIIGLLLTAGYTAEEILRHAFDMTLFQDLSSVKLAEMPSHIGLIPNTVIKNQLEQLVEAKLGFVPTLKQLYMATGILLEVVSVNLNTTNTVYFSANTEPQINCVEATLLSMNIPLLFYKLEYKGELYIDGAFGNPYPVDRHDDGETDILGIYISTREHIVGDMDPLIYIHKIIDSPSVQILKRVIESSSKRCRHIRLKNRVMDTTGVSLSLEDKVKMVVRGYKKTAKQLKTIPDKTVYMCNLDADVSIDYESNVPNKDDESLV